VGWRCVTGKNFFLLVIKIKGACTMQECFKERKKPDSDWAKKKEGII